MDPTKFLFPLLILFFGFMLGCTSDAPIPTVNKIELAELCHDSTFATLLASGRAEENWSFEYEEFEDDSLFRRNVFIVDSFHVSLDVHESMWTLFGLDSLFTREEVDGYKDQPLQIEKGCLPDYQFISRDSLMARKQMDRNSPGYFVLKYNSFSKPLISANGKFALMEINSYCGPLCGAAFTYLFVKDSGNWKILRSTLRWVS